MKPREAALKYIEAKKNKTLCMQNQFKQLCSRCQHYRGVCDIYNAYIEAWMNLQESVK